jgi:hypothetical protein
MHREPGPQPATLFLAKAFHDGLARMRTQIVHDQVDSVRLGITGGDVQQVIGELGRGTSGRYLGKVPACFRLDSTEHVGRATTFIFAVSSSYASRSHGQRGTNLLVENAGFSSTQTTGSCPQNGFSYTANTSSMRPMYSSSSSAMHHIFFPPRLQVVAFQQDPHRLSSHPRHQLAFHRLFRQQANGPPCPAGGRRTAHQRHDALALLRV